MVKIHVKLPPDLYDRLYAHVGAPAGRHSGISGYVRALIARDLAEAEQPAAPAPPPAAE